MMKGETKNERFSRVATKRVQRVLDSLRSLTQCSNRRMYQWDNQMLKKMWAAIEREYQACKANFEKSEPEDFKF
jgi:hypothetical protein